MKKKNSNFGENGQLNCCQRNFMKRHKVWQCLLLSKKKIRNIQSLSGRFVPASSVNRISD